MNWHDEREPPVYRAGERTAELEAAKQTNPKVFTGARPCPCCACNPGRPGDASLANLTLEQEARAHAEWALNGCPNNPRLCEPRQFEIEWFDRRECSRSEAWRCIEVENPAKNNRWKKCHTARTWCWVRA